MSIRHDYNRAYRYLRLGDYCRPETWVRGIRYDALGAAYVSFAERDNTLPEGYQTFRLQMILNLRKAFHDDTYPLPVAI